MRSIPLPYRTTNIESSLSYSISLHGTSSLGALCGFSSQSQQSGGMTGRRAYPCGSSGDISTKRRYTTSYRAVKDDEEPKLKEREGRKGFFSSFFSFMNRKKRFPPSRPSVKYPSSRGFQCYRIPPPCDCRDFEIASPPHLPTAQELYDALMTFVERGKSEASPISPSSPPSFAWKVKVEAGSSCSSFSSSSSSSLSSVSTSSHNVSRGNGAQILFTDKKGNETEENGGKKKVKNDDAKREGASSFAFSSFFASDPLSGEKTVNYDESEDEAVPSSSALCGIEQQKIIHRTFFDLTYRCGACGQCACRRGIRRTEKGGDHPPGSASTFPPESPSSSSMNTAWNSSAFPPPPPPPCRFPFCYTMRPIIKGAEVWQGRQIIEENVMSAWWWRQAQRSREEIFPRNERKNKGDPSVSTPPESPSCSDENQESKDDISFQSMEDLLKNTKELEKLAILAGLPFQHFSPTLIVECVMKLQPSPLLFPTTRPRENEREAEQKDERSKVSSSDTTGTDRDSSSSSYSHSNQKAMREVIDTLERWIAAAVSIHVPSFSREDEEEYFQTRSIVLRAAKRENKVGKMSEDEGEISPGKTLRSAQLFHIPHRDAAPATPSSSCSSSSLAPADAPSISKKEERSTWGEEVIRLSIWRAALLVNQGRDEEAVRFLMYLSRKLLALAQGLTGTSPNPSSSLKFRHENHTLCSSQGEANRSNSVRASPSFSGTENSDSQDHQKWSFSLPSRPPPVDFFLLRTLCEAATNWAVLNDMEIITYRSITKQFVPSPPDGSDSPYFFPLGHFFANDRPLLLSDTFSELEKMEESGRTLPSVEKELRSRPYPSSTSPGSSFHSPLNQLLEHCAELVLQKEIGVQVSRLQLASHRNKSREEVVVDEGLPEGNISKDSAGLIEKGRNDIVNEKSEENEKTTLHNKPMLEGEKGKSTLKNSGEGSYPSSTPLWLQRWWKTTNGKKTLPTRRTRKTSTPPIDGTNTKNFHTGKRDEKAGEEEESEVFEEHPFHSLCVPLTLSYYRFYVHPRFWRQFFTLLCLPPLPSSPSSSASSTLAAGKGNSSILVKDKVFPTHVLDAVGRSILLYHLIIFAEARFSSQEEDSSSSSLSSSCSSRNRALRESPLSHQARFGEVLTEKEVGIAKDALRALMSVIQEHDTQKSP